MFVNCQKQSSSKVTNLIEATNCSIVEIVVYCTLHCITVYFAAILPTGNASSILTVHFFCLFKDQFLLSFPIFVVDNLCVTDVFSKHTGNGM